jgi:hypothetical protein
LIVFAFGQFVPIGGMNFICPYSEEATQGMALALLMIFFLARDLVGPRWINQLLAGLGFGLCWLTRAEISAAALAAAVSWLLCARFIKPAPSRPFWPRLLLFPAGALAPAAGFFVYFVAKMPAGAALRAIGGSWTILFFSEARHNAFFVTGMGMDRPGANFLVMLAMFAGTLLVLALLATIAALAPSKKPAATIAMIIAGAAIFFGALASPWLEVERVLPLTTVAMLAALLVLFIRHRGDEALASRLAALIVWSVFALVLLGKIILRAEVYHYGFYLAMPAMLILAGGLCWLTPWQLDRTFGGGKRFRGLSLVLISGVLIFHVVSSWRIYRLRDFQVGQAGDEIVAFGERLGPEGPAVAAALNWIETNVPENASFVVLPEGVILNYLTRRPNPTPYQTFMMTELIGFGEENILASFQAARPDYFILVHKDTSDYGVGYFGADPRYGEKIMAWVNANYSRVMLIGAEPLRDERFGVKIMERNK